MPTMNVSLTGPLSEFVESEVASGDYGTASEVVRDALRLLRREKALEAERLEVLRREVGLGIDQIRRGEMSSRSIADIAADVIREAGT